MPVKVEEKRRFPRISLHTPIHFQIRGLFRPDNAITQDISVGGLSFISDRFIVPSSIVRLEINVLSRILSTAGRIAWSQPLPHSDRNQSGIEFLELGCGERDYLCDYINMQRGKF